MFKTELETTKTELLLLKNDFNKEVKRLKEIEQEKGSYFLMKLLQHIIPAKKVLKSRGMILPQE